LILDRFAATIDDDEHVGMTLDQGGWHGSGDLRVPDNITLGPLARAQPGRARVLYLKDCFLSHRLHAGYDAIVEAACNAWDRLKNEAGCITSLCSCP